MFIAKLHQRFEVNNRLKSTFNVFTCGRVFILNKHDLSTTTEVSDLNSCRWKGHTFSYTHMLDKNFRYLHGTSQIFFGKSHRLYNIDIFTTFPGWLLEIVRDNTPVWKWSRNTEPSESIWSVWCSDWLICGESLGGQIIS